MMRGGDLVVPTEANDIHACRKRAKKRFEVFGHVRQNGGYPVRLADALVKVRDSLVSGRS
ncbi:MAG: hypothetical protein O3C21_05610 [Verrucomicrobia bacterium]|nr:hypothetical protein [Verrucomicrobiota bacterium]